MADYTYTFDPSTNIATSVDATIKAVMKKESDGQHQASHYLVVEDAEKPTTWHLRVRNVDGELDRRLMGAAWAALHGGSRGNRYKGPQKQEAIAKLRKLYEQVGAEPPAKSATGEHVPGTAVKVLAIDEDTITIGGYGVVWDGVDLEGETFTKDTDFELDTVPRKPVFYNHTLTGVKNKLGVTITEKLDDVGMWVEAELERHRDYVEQVLQLVKAGALGWSSGAVAHLVEREGRTLKRWPIYEFSLTPTPAEPRTLGVELIKSLAEADPRLKAFLPQGAEDASASASGAKATNKHPQVQNEGKTMTDIVKDENEVDTPNTTVNEAPGIDVKALITEIRQAAIDAAKTSAQEAVAAVLAEQPPTNDAGFAVRMANAPATLKHPLGDSETKAISAWVKTGDGGTYAGDIKLVGDKLTLKASNDTSMNITTDADGGYAVPTGHFNQIIAKRDEGLLAKKLGVRMIPGRGTTVNVPVDNEANGEFVATSEQNDAHTNNFDRDAPAITQKAFTLTKYSKKIELTDELLQDEDSRLMAFLENFIGRGMAKTHNNLLLTEVASNGTLLKTFASATAIAAGEPQDIVGNNDLSAYLDDDTGIAWVMRSATYWDIASLQGSDFVYYPTPAGGPRELLSYPVVFSQKAAATAASAKDVYFGNWYYVGYRESPELTLLRDPYTVDGMLLLKYYFRTVYGVLQTEAVGYGQHPTG